jgi:hypothetical protein
MDSKKTKIISIAVAVVVAVAFIVIKQFVLPPILDNIKISKELKEAAESENSKCPNTIADGLVMDKVTFVKKDKKVVYEARFLNYSKSDFDLEEFKASVTQGLITEMAVLIKSDDSFKGYVNKNVIFEYVYLDNEYEELVRVKILLSDPVKAVD